MNKKVYNLGRESLAEVVGGEQCHCALGIILAEKLGMTFDEIRTSQEPYDKVSEIAGLDEVAEILWAEAPPGRTRPSYATARIYRANDDWAPLSLISRALSAMGIDVELIDKRGLNIPEESNG